MPLLSGKFHVNNLSGKIVEKLDCSYTSVEDRIKFDRESISDVPLEVCPVISDEKILNEVLLCANSNKEGPIIVEGVNKEAVEDIFKVTRFVRSLRK